MYIVKSWFYSTLIFALVVSSKASTRYGYNDDNSNWQKECPEESYIEVKNEWWGFSQPVSGTYDNSLSRNTVENLDPKSWTKSATTFDDLPTVSYTVSYIVMYQFNIRDSSEGMLDYPFDQIDFVQETISSEG